MIDEEQLHFPDGAFVWKDLGYKGSTLGNILCFEMHKKPRNKELTSEQKAENYLIESIRKTVEHAINGVKRCRIVKETIRVYNSQIRDKVVVVCSALHNFRTRKRQSYSSNATLRFCPI